MKVKEFLDVISWNIIDYAKIYEMVWNEKHQQYVTTYTNKRVFSRKDIEPYLDYELYYMNYETHHGGDDDSEIYIKMSKEVTVNE